MVIYQGKFFYHKTVQGEKFEESRCNNFPQNYHFISMTVKRFFIVLHSENDQPFCRRYMQ